MNKELLMKYLKGEPLAQHKIDAIESEMKTKPNLLKEMEVMIDMIDDDGGKDWLEHEIALYGKREQFKNTVSELLKVNTEEENHYQKVYSGAGRKGIKRLIPLAIAASVVGLVALFWLLRPNGDVNEALFAQHFKAYPVIDGFKRSEAPERTEGGNKSAGQRAINAYGIRDYSMSIPLFMDAFTKEQDTIALYYAAIAQLASGEAKEAIVSIKKFRQISSLFEPQLLWYEALANVRQGNIKVAKEQLETLTQQNNSYSGKAKSLLEQLE